MARGSRPASILVSPEADPGRLVWTSADLTPTPADRDGPRASRERGLPARNESRFRSPLQLTDPAPAGPGPRHAGPALRNRVPGFPTPVRGGGGRSPSTHPPSGFPRTPAGSARTSGNGSGTLVRTGNDRVRGGGTPAGSPRTRSAGAGVRSRSPRVRVGWTRTCGGLPDPGLRRPDPRRTCPGWFRAWRRSVQTWGTP